MLPATLAGYGAISLVGWVASCIGALSMAFVLSWLSRLRPNATGGPYAYVHEGMGDLPAILLHGATGSLSWATNAAIAVAFVSYLGAFIPVVSQNPLVGILTGLGAIWFLTWINTIGVREAGIVQVVTTILKIAPLILLSIGGLFYLNTDHFVPFNASGGSGNLCHHSINNIDLVCFPWIGECNDTGGEHTEPGEEHRQGYDHRHTAHYGDLCARNHCRHGNTSTRSSKDVAGAICRCSCGDMG